LDRRVGGRLLWPVSPLAACAEAPDGRACRAVLAQMQNPFFIGDEPALTQASGWAGAWTSTPSAYAVAAQSAADMAAAVDFARQHRVRLVMKGAGHSYQGTSSASDSLLIWTRSMRDIALHDAFVGMGCADAEPLPAVSLGAGCLWLHAYDAVTTQAGRYVQGGGCTTVGVAGLIQSGGFGSFSKCFGLAAASLLEAEIVTADGVVRTVNACREPDLFWALKGGGGGTFGVVTRLTLRTHPLPDLFGAVFGRIRARSDDACRRLIARFVAFYADHLHTPHSGETARFTPDNSLHITMVFQGLDQSRAEALWAPFLQWLEDNSADYEVQQRPTALALPARRMWDARWLRQNAPDLIASDTRPGAPEEHFVWRGDVAQTGQFIHGYHSRWLPAALLRRDDQPALADALFAASRRWALALHFNKGLAGASDEVIGAARETAIHPGAIDAFALAISAAEGPPAFQGLLGARPDPTAAAARATQAKAAMAALEAVSPAAGSYVVESDYFEEDWQRSFWGANYERLAAIKRRYDPTGIFTVHHGVEA
jgi:FAD/FMN-containing dehydrogenase